MFPKRPIFHQGLAIGHEVPLRAVFHLSGCFYVCCGGSSHVLLIVGLYGWGKDIRLEIVSTLSPLHSMLQFTVCLNLALSVALSFNSIQFNQNLFNCFDFLTHNLTVSVHSCRFHSNVSRCSLCFKPKQQITLTGKHFWSQRARYFFYVNKLLFAKVTCQCFIFSAHKWLKYLLMQQCLHVICTVNQNVFCRAVRGHQHGH